MAIDWWKIMPRSKKKTYYLIPPTPAAMRQLEARDPELARLAKKEFSRWSDASNICRRIEEMLSVKKGKNKLRSRRKAKS